MDKLTLFISKGILMTVIAVITIFRSIIRTLFSVADRISLYFIRYGKKLENQYIETTLALEEQLKTYVETRPLEITNIKRNLGKYAGRVAVLRSGNKQ